MKNGPAEISKLISTNIQYSLRRARPSKLK
jgi:hypothetical protein